MKKIYTLLTIALMCGLMAFTQNKTPNTFPTQAAYDAGGTSKTQSGSGSVLRSLEMPEAWFPFDGDFQDYSGNNYHGTNEYTSWTTDRHGNPNGALAFDGWSSGVRLDNGYPPVFQGSLTFSCWAYFNDDSRGVLFGSFDGSNNVNFEKHTDNRLRIYWNHGERNIITSSDVVSGNSWHFVTFTRDVNADSFKIYANGQLVDTFSDAGSNITPGEPFYIGRDTRYGSTVVNGKMDDIRIYGSALSDAEVLELYNQTASLPELSTTPVTGITPFSAISGGQIIYSGTSPVTSRGVVWDTTENPTTENNLGMTNNGFGLGEFTSNLNGLEPVTTYYVRSYAGNATGTAYGPQLIFTTPSNNSVSGVWTAANSPFFIDDVIIIPAGDTLIIEPGVTVKFKTNSVDITELNPPTPNNTTAKIEPTI